MKLKMEVHWPCCPSSILRKNASRLFCDDIAGSFSWSISTSGLQRSGPSFPRKHRIQSKAILFCNQHSFAALCLQRRGNSDLHGDPSVFFESNSRVLLYVPYSFLGFLRQRRRHIALCDSLKQYSEGSSSHQDQRETFREQKPGENGALSSSQPLPSSLLPVALPAEEISNEEFSETKRLVETAMLAAAAGLAYYLSNTLRIENYFGCFFPLPLVISSLRWGVIAGRKTMAATAMLLLVLSGPLKAATYLLMHGFLGLTMGSLWRSKMSWGASLLICTLVRSLGAMGFVFLSSWLIRDNILALITINAHASISFMLAAMGINFVPSMGSIYFIFGTLVLLNCGTFVFILHVLYAIFLKRLGLHSPLIFPAWLKAL